MTRSQAWTLGLKRLVEVHALGRWLMLSALVGCVAGLGAIAFYFATNAVDLLVLQGWGGYVPPGETLPAGPPGTEVVRTLHMHFRWFLFLIPAVGGLVSGFLVYTFAPEAEGHGTDGAIDAFHNKAGVIRRRVPLVKALASIVTIGTGGSAGREGPIAQIGAGFGSFLATRLGLSVAERRILLLAGIAGGIGATFRAPLGGALFAVEVLYRDPEFEHEGLVPCIISSIIAYSLFGIVTGWEPLLTTPRFRFNNPRELVLYFLLAVLVAAAGVLYVRVFYRTRDAFRALKIPRALKPALGGLLLGLLALLVPQVLGSGYSWVQEALYGKLSLWLMLVIGLAKIVGTSLTISSGGSGGVFAPSLVIGAMIGGAFGATVGALFPTVVEAPQAYVLVGMAGFFAGVANTPLATLIMVSELTGNYGLLAPLMLVCIVAMITVRHNSIYEKQVNGRFDSPAHHGDYIFDVLEGLTVGDLADRGRRPVLIPEGLPLPQILQKIAATDEAYFPVVNADGDMTGILSVNDLRRTLDEDFPVGLVIARDVAIPRVITTTPGEPLNQAMRKLTNLNLEEIPVVDPSRPRRVSFMLSHRAVLARYAAEMEKKHDGSRKG